MFILLINKNGYNNRRLHRINAKRLRAATAGEVSELDRQHLLALVRTDAELGEIVMRAF
jgi:hypothetical protein